MRTKSPFRVVNVVNENVRTVDISTFIDSVTNNVKEQDTVKVVKSLLPYSDISLPVIITNGNVVLRIEANNK